ncbi:MAG: hypothetical protein OEY79_00820, partial [Anaplasmataceae bacterium]|nr:hypothetical protein [Anaplasmataceae bacterium]
MNYKYLISLLFFFIVGCAHECVLRDAFLYDIYTNNIMAQPEGIIANKLDTYWVDTGLDLDGKASQKINIIKSDNINFCSDREGIDIKLDQNNTAYIIDKIFSQGDKFEINLALYKGISITDSVCENKNSEVYVGDESKCKNDLLSKTYKVEIGDDNS